MNENEPTIISPSTFVELAAAIRKTTGPVHVCVLGADSELTVKVVKSDLADQLEGRGDDESDLELCIWPNGFQLLTPRHQ